MQDNNTSHDTILADSEGRSSGLRLADVSTSPPAAAAPVLAHGGMASISFDFRDLGEVQAKGLNKATRLFAPLGPGRDPGKGVPQVAITVGS